MGVALKLGYKAAALAGFVCAGLATPQAASAQLFLHDPNFKPGPIQGSDPLVGIPIPGATAEEYRAHLLWNLRAGLNVGALQCQFSPYLRSVDNYNGILAHHSDELASAYTALTGYFKRVHGAKEGVTKFDDYSTSTYNDFSTLQAQYGFCQTSADIAKEALTRPKGQLHLTAQSRLRELRNSLIPAWNYVVLYNPHTIRIPLVPAAPNCAVMKKRERRQCEALYG